ncbi:hypothetical protein B0T17DRAFT_504263 [Bombardia bombarda]|uniref:Uncharacterized protein n=1 Tax=Bombardia bombarda TaxID=252184 RepID=A0AA40CFS0_9PEZI|nr:hypothetical protein B0T17DRAFT_504263 [Bombardia bombarda]
MHQVGFMSRTSKWVSEQRLRVHSSVRCGACACLSGAGVVQQRRLQSADGATLLGNIVDDLLVKPYGKLREQRDPTGGGAHSVPLSSPRGGCCWLDVRQSVVYVCVPAAGASTLAGFDWFDLFGPFDWGVEEGGRMRTTHDRDPLDVKNLGVGRFSRFDGNPWPWPAMAGGRPRSHNFQRRGMNGDWSAPASGSPRELVGRLAPTLTQAIGIPNRNFRSVAKLGDSRSSEGEPRGTEPP